MSAGVNVIVGQRVDDVFAVALELDEARLLEHAQLMGDGALRDADDVGDVGNAAIGFHERVKDLDARGVGECLEQVGEVVEQLVVGHGLEHVLVFLPIAAAKALVCDLWRGKKFALA